MLPELYFLYFDHDKKAVLVQVCYSLDDINTKEREFAGLKGAMRNLQIDVGTLVVQNLIKEERISVEEGEVRLVPGYQFFSE